MNTQNHHKPELPLADQNVERLLNEAYQPEAPNAEFAGRVRQAMQAAARQRRREASATRSKRPSTPTDWRTMAATALTISVVLVAAVMAFRSGQNVARHDVPATPSSVEFVQSQDEPIAARGALTPRKARPAPNAERLSIGQTISTRRGERRRLALPDGSVLYVNQNTSARLIADRRLRVESGEVFVEVSPKDELALGAGLPTPPKRPTEGLPDGETSETSGQRSGAVGRPHHSAEATEWRPSVGEVVRSGDRPTARPPHNRRDAAGHTFLVETPDREVTALGTKFSVGVDKAGTNVLVVQGKVKLDNLTRPLLAGERFMPKPVEAARTAPHVSAAPRASHLLDWTEPLMAAAHSPLVPRSEYAGGSLTAVDPNGQERKFSLRKYHVDVHIEDGFARTTIDQTYFNHLDARLEGTFHFPLPPDASISRLAMYVGGKLMEGGMVERNHGRQVFESIKYRMLDPALLEWVDGSTFKMRVFPLEGRQEKRIVLSYTQRLDSLYGRTRYRFPAGHSLEKIGRWSLHVRAKNLADADWSCVTHNIVAKQDGRDLVLESEATNVAAGRDVVLDLISTYGTSGAAPRFSSARHEGARYLMVRYRPEFDADEVATRRLRRDWIFLFESSADRDPVLARAQVEIVRALLDNAEHDDTFRIITANTRTRQLATSFNRRPIGPRVDAPQPSRGPLGQRLNEKATPANVAAAIEQLDQTHLIGALDLEQAFGAVGQMASGLKNPVVVHLGSGTPVLGERDETTLRGLLPEKIHYVGVGVGKHWNRGLMKALAARSGGYFTQINPDDAIGWQAFDLLATLNTPRLVDVQAADPAGRRRWLVFNDALADGDEFCAVTRVAGNQPLPKSVVVSGSLDGRPYQRQLTVSDVAPGADYLPRQWAKLEIDRLVADDAAKHRDEIIALSKSMYVMSPFTSLLVLENEAMYEQYQVDRGRKDHWALYPCPEKIEVLYEPLPPAPAPLATADKSKGEDNEKWAEILATILRGLPHSAGTGRANEYASNSLQDLSIRAFRRGHNDLIGPYMPPVTLWDGQTSFRDPGRINLNTVTDPVIWRALINGRVNVNTSGDINAWNARMNHSSSMNGPALPQGSGYGPAEINLRRALSLIDSGGTLGDSPIDDKVNAMIRALSTQIDPAGVMIVRNRDLVTTDSWTMPVYSTPQSVFERNGGFGDDIDFDRLIELIRQTIQPDTWEEVGGPGSVAEFETNLSLVVSQTQNPPSADSLREIELRLQALENAQVVNGVARTDIAANPTHNFRGRMFFDQLWMDELDGHALPSPYYQSDDVQYFAPGPEFPLTREKVMAQRQSHTRGLLPADLSGITYRGWYNAYDGDRNDSTFIRRAYLDLVGNPRTPFEAANLLGDIYDQPPIVFPSAETWKKLTFRRSKYASLDLQQRDREAEEILKQLNEPTRMGFEETPLDEVVSYLSEFHGIQIELDAEALKDLGLDGQTKVTANFKAVTLHSALRQVLGKLHPSLTFVIDPRRRLLLITSRSAAARYHPLTFSCLAFAPALRASWADVLGVLDRETEVGRGRKGQIDPGARELFAAARDGRWRRLALVERYRDDASRPMPLLVFDDRGHVRIDRITSDGLRETVICDGAALWHVYPEIGIAARREMSRFHRAAIAANLPWVVPPVEDLAHGADVRLAAERTVDIVPIDKMGGSGDPPKARSGDPPTTTAPPTTKDGQSERFVKLRLVFAKDGSLRQRQWLEMPGDKVLLTMDLDEGGAITWTDRQGKTRRRAEIQLAEGDEPDLEPRVENLTVVPMPLRTVDHLVTSSGLTMSNGEIKWTRDVKWTDEQASAAIAAVSAQGNAKLATEIMCYWFYDSDREDWEAAFYRFLPLLASAGVNWAADVQSTVKQQLGRDWNPLEEFPDTPMGRFLVGGDVTDRPIDGFVQSLATLRGLLVQLQTADAHDAELPHKAALFVKQVRSPCFAWAVLSRLQVDEHDTEAHNELAEAYAPLADVHAFSYAARYERAAHLHSAGSVEDAQKAFLNLLQETFDAGIVPPFDKRLPDAFDADDPFGGNPFADDNSFHDIILRNARKLAERHATLPLVRLAWQCRWAGQAAVADELIELVRTDGADPRSEGRRDSRLTDWVRLGVLQYYWATEQPEPADAVLAELLDERQLAKLPNLWLLGAEIADRRGRLAEAADRHRKALDLAYGKLEGRIDVEAVRRDFGALMDRYDKLSRAIGHPSVEPPLHLVAAVIGAADRWRALEVDVTEVCRRTAKIFAILGADQLAWDYATTPVAGRGTESAPWTELAQSLADEDSLELADRAFETAYEMEPTNADILWQHGQMLESKGRRDRAMALYRKIAGGDWQPRFSGTKSRARQRLQAKE